MPKILLLLKLLVVTLIFSAAQLAYAQALRTLPANGKRGITGEKQPLPAVIINRTAAKLAPGGVIFDTYNRTILHQDLPSDTDIWYQLDMQGDIQRIYILTPDERARLDQARK